MKKVFGSTFVTNIDCYHGFDPNPCLQDGYTNIINFFRGYLLVIIQFTKALPKEPVPPVINKLLFLK